MKLTVVGGGWAGLAAALQASQLGHQVTLLEAAPKPGGRARSVTHEGDVLDNGQHLFLGAYQNFLKMLTMLNVPEQSVLRRVPFHLCLHDFSPASEKRSKVELKLAPLPAPFNFLSAFLLSKGFSIHEFQSIVRFWQYLKKANSTLQNDISVLQLLKNLEQSDTLVQKLWGPLALAALTTPIQKASAKIFLNVLKAVFNHSANYTDFLYPKQDLNLLFPEPAVHYLKSRGHSVFSNTRVLELEIKENKCVGVKTNHPQRLFLPTDGIILATPPKTTLKLLEPHAMFNTLHPSLSQFSYQPIITVYLKYANGARLKDPMIGFINSKAHWIFDRTLSSSGHSIISVVISGEGEHMHLTEEALLHEIKQDIKQFNVDLGNPIRHKMITEKQAAFSCTPDIEKIRPEAKTPMANLFLAGDYTNTNLPATLEGAILSGITAADALHRF